MRTLSVAAAAALAGRNPSIIQLLQILTTPPIYLNSSAVTIEAGGLLYYGIGTLGSIDTIKDTPGGSQSLTLTLSGIPSDLLAVALQENVRGAVVRVHLGVYDPTTQVMLDMPLVFTGFIDQTPIEHGASTSTIPAIAMHRGETFARPKPFRNTDGDQQAAYPGDTSRRYVVAQSQHQDIWPSAAYLRR